MDLIFSNFKLIKFKIFIYKIFFLNFSYAQVYLPELKKLIPKDMPPPTIVAKRITKPIKIDGYLKDEGWKEAAVDSFMWKGRPYLGPPEVKTKFFVGYDDENLYLAFLCYEKDIREIRAVKAEERRAGIAITYGDFISFNIYTDTIAEEKFSFYINPLGVKEVLYVNWSIPIVKSADILWYADAKICDSAWVAEIKIPFKSLKLPQFDYFKFSPLRVRVRDVSYSYLWHYPSPPGADPFKLSPYAGKLYIPERPKLMQRFELLPYLITNFEKDRKTFTKFGLTGKYFFTFKNILDFTLLPDYSQIETDMPQIDVNTTFALYYPEKRPFFVEGKELFQTPIKIFYSRTINDPLFGLKFQGDIKGFEVAYLLGYDNHTPWILPFPENSYSISSNKKSLSNIIQIKKDLLRNSYISLLITDRSLEKSFSRVFSINGGFSFSKYNFLSYQGVFSVNREPNDTNLFKGYSFLDSDSYTSGFDGEKFYGKGFHLNFKHQDPRFHLNLLWEGLSPFFRADNGFIQYNDYEKRKVFFGIYFPFKNFILENIFPNFEIQEKRRFFGKRNLYENKFSTFLNFKRQINLNITYTVRFQEYKGIDFKNLWRWVFYFSASPIAFFHTYFGLQYGKEINYFSYPLTSGYLLYPNFNINFYFGNFRKKMGYSRYIMWEKEFKNRVYNAETFTNEIAYLFTKNTAFRIITQYSSTSSSLFIYPLFSFEPTPFTLFYIGSNFTLIKGEDDSKFITKNYKFFLKFQYQLKF